MQKLAIMSAVLLAAVATAKAQEFQKVDGLLPGRAEFDAPDGRFQHWGSDVGCKANALRGLLTFKRLGKPTTKWQPALAVVLQRGDVSANNDIVKLSVVAPDFTPTFRARLEVDRVGPDHQVREVLQAQDYAAVVEGDQVIPFSITWTAGGEVAASFGGETHRVSLHDQIDHIVVAGSSGAGVLDPLEIGIVGDLVCKPLAGAPGSASPGG
jgi:hypothetical protein